MDSDNESDIEALEFSFAEIDISFQVAFSKCKVAASLSLSAVKNRVVDEDSAEGVM